MANLGNSITGDRIDSRLIVVFVFLLLYAPVLLDYGIGYRSAVQVDLESFYWASIVTFQQGDSPYGPEAFAGIESLWGHGQVNPYWYPPPSLLCFYPLSWFSYGTVQILALLLNHALLLVLLWIILFRVLRLKWDNDNWRFTTLAVAYMLSFYPTIATIYYGQVNLAVAICLCLVWLGVRDNAGPALVAIPLTLAIVLKSYPILLLSLLFMKKQYRAMVWTIALSAVVLLLSWLTLPDAAWADWASKILPGGGYGSAMPGLESPAAPWNQSINGLTSRLFLGSHHSTPLIVSETAAHVVPYLLAAVVAVLSLGWCWRSAGHSGVDHTDLQMAVILPMIYLIAPFTWEHHGVFILPVIVILLQRLLPAWRERVVLLTILTISALVLAWYLPFQSPKLTSGLATLLISIKFYAAVGIWGVALAMLIGAGRSQDH